METCDLNECDFLETHFHEYTDEDEFKKDGTFTETECGKLKGIMICFMVDDYPKYEYSPIGISESEHEIWKEEIMEKYNNCTWLKNIYWRLEKLSCVLVLRNKLWFNIAIDKIKETWDIIEKERITGYDHRKPKKVIKKGEIKVINTTNNKCLIDIDSSTCLDIITDKPMDEMHSN